MKERILLIEDDGTLRDMLCEALNEQGYRITVANSAEEGIAFARAGCDLILTDVMLPGMSGIEAIPELRKAGSGADIIVMTARADRELALEAIRQGAYDFFVRPFSLKELGVVMRRVFEKRRLQSEVMALRESLHKEGAAQRIIGKSRAIREVHAFIEKVAPLDTTVLITGESGTGKEVVADTLCALSPRRDKPFLKINCAAIPEHLFENELFGHERGAFTGAASAQAGKFELADGGTLLLDEIGDMPLVIQPKLLRVVEEKKVERLGAKRAVPLDVRIIAATNQNLEARVSEKAFRGDLYYRLNVAMIALPPLRERKEDIPLLAVHLVHKLGDTLGVPVRGITKDAIALLMEYHWPGNVRQLANLLEGTAIRANGYITAQDIRQTLASLTAPGQGATCVGGTVLSQASEKGGRAYSLRETLRQVEYDLLREALRQAGGSQKDAARLLGLTPKNMWAKLHKHGIKVQRGAE